MKNKKNRWIGQIGVIVKREDVDSINIEYKCIVQTFKKKI